MPTPGAHISNVEAPLMRFARLVVVAAASLIVSVASAQTIPLFPASQYGRNYLTLPQSAAGLSTTQLQNVLGRNANFERLDSYRADDRFRKMAAPVGRLDLLIEGAGGTGVGNCTASIISQRYIMTNSHCFPSRDRVVRGSLLMGFYSEDNDRDARRFEIAAAPAEVNAELDYAIVEVRGNPSAAFGTVRLDPRDPQPGESLLIIHHPMGMPKHMTRGGCRASQPNAVDGVDIRHRCDTLPGSSGSPILAEATGRMVGLHYGGTTNPSATSWNSGKRLAEIARRSRILAAVVTEQRQDDEAGARAASGQAEIERRAQAAEIERLRAQLDAERARVAALPPAAATRAETPANWAAAEAALGLTPDRIREMQRSLGALGHDPRGVDGNLGAGTRAAIRSWQKSRGMPETGYASGDLLRSLDEARNAVAAAVRPAAPVIFSAPAQPAVGIYPAVPPREPPRSFRDCPECPEMVVIPAGSTRLASGRDVTIATPLAVGKFEVTFEEWGACVAGGGFFLGSCMSKPDDHGWGRGRQPAINISWDDAQQYVAWLSRKTGKAYRLLSEAEWEYAAQAGTGREQAIQLGANQANCDGCGSPWDNKQPAPVGSFAANAFGLHDMLGNVWEWTADCWNDSHVGAPADGAARTIGDCSRRALRGGSWFLRPSFARSSDRVRFTPGFRNRDDGFRVARTL